MRVKLTVAHSEKGGEARTYILEQDPITIGRAGTCDLPLDDPDRVVSKEHAQIRRGEDGLRLFDLGSKNQSFVNGERVGQAGLPLKEGDKVQLGPFEVSVSIDTGMLVVDDLDRTVFGTAFVNPFLEPAKGVAEALAELRQSYSELDYGHRAEALRVALADSLGSDASAVSAVVLGQAVQAPAAEAAVADVPTAAPEPVQQPAAAPPADDVLQALAGAAARLVSIPGKFRHEFLGHTVIHAPETAFLFDADVDALIRHLSPEDESARSGRQELLISAAEAVLRHHQALLEGYRAAVRDGAGALLDAVDPDKLDAEGGLAGGLMPGAKDRALLDRVRERVADLRGESFAATERRIYQPAFTQAYLDSLARMASAPAEDPFEAPAVSPDAAAASPLAAPAVAEAFAAPLAPAYAAPPADPYAARPADPYAAPPADPYAAPPADPYAAPPADPYAAPPADPYATPPADPYAARPADPYATPPADPYAVPPADPYAVPPADPYAVPPADPYAVPPADPYAAPPADPFASGPGALPPDPFAPGAPDPFASAPDPFADLPSDPFNPPPKNES